MRIPDGFVTVGGVGAQGFARPDAVEQVREDLVRWGSLARAGSHASDALALEGRGPVHAVAAPGGGRWVIRRYRRGGWMAPLLGDRYLLRGTPRPVTETLASEAARQRGIATPRVVAGMVYPSRLFYRADLVSEWVPDTHDLARLLFPPQGAAGSGPGLGGPATLLREAGGLVRRLATAGIRHRDLNAKNILVGPGHAGHPHLLVLDLDRATVHEPGTVQPDAMGKRLIRSLRKFEGLTGRTLDPEAWEALSRALSTGADPT